MSEITLSAYTIRPSAQTASIGTARYYYAQNMESDGIFVSGSAVFSDVFFTAANWALVDGLITVEDSPVYTTVNSDRPDNTLTIVLYDADGNQVQGQNLVFSGPVPNSLGSVVTLEELITYADAVAIAPPPPPQSAWVDIVDSLIQSALGSRNATDVNTLGLVYTNATPAIADHPVAVLATSRIVSDFYNITAYPYLASTSKTAAQNATAITAANAAALAAGAGLYIPVGAFTSNSVSITVPVQFAPGASIFKPASGAVNMSKAITADLSQHFDLSLGGTITFGGNQSLTCAYPEWWEANTVPGTTDMTAAIRAAIAATVATCRVYLTGYYAISGSIDLTNLQDFWIDGNGYSARIVNLASANKPTFLLDGTTDFYFSNFSVIGRAGFPNDVFKVQNHSAHGTWYRVLMNPNGKGIHFDNSVVFKIIDCDYWPSGFGNGATTDAGTRRNAILADGTQVNDVHVYWLNAVGYETIADGGAGIKWDTAGVGTSQNIEIVGCELEGLNLRSIDLAGVFNAQITANYLDGTDVRILRSREVFPENNYGITSYSAGDGSAPNGCLNVIVRGAPSGSCAIDSQSTSCGAQDSIFDQAGGYVNSGTNPITVNVRNSGGLLPDQGGAAGVRWYAHAVPEGTITTPTYSAGNFTSDTGTWVVDSGDITTYAYSFNGKKMTIDFLLSNTTITGTPNALRIVIPGGYMANERTSVSYWLKNNGGATIQSEAQVLVIGTTTITLWASPDGGSNFVAGANNNDMRGSITFEVQ